MAEIVSLQLKSNFENAGVLIPENVDWEFVEDYSEENIITKLKEASILYCGPSYPFIGESILKSCRHLKLIQSSGVGFDSIDVKAAEKYGIPVSNSPGQNTNSVAEHVLGQIVVLLRNMHVADSEIKKGNYKESRTALLKGGVYEIRDLQIGVIGAGNIGREISRLCSVLGARIVYNDVNRLDSELENELGILFMEFNELLKTSDVIVVQVPRMEKTINLISKNELFIMKKTAILINSARGGIVNESDLAEALENSDIRGAAIDNFNNEIPDENNPLLNMSESASKKIFISPHLGGVTRQAIYRMFNQSVENSVNVLTGGKPRFVVNNVK